jgi:hypothetical protein
VHLPIAIATVGGRCVPTNRDGIPALNRPSLSCGRIELLRCSAFLRARRLELAL